MLVFIRPVVRLTFWIHSFWIWKLGLAVDADVGDVAARPLDGLTDLERGGDRRASMATSAPSLVEARTLGFLVGAFGDVIETVVVGNAHVLGLGAVDPVAEDVGGSLGRWPGAAPGRDAGCSACTSADWNLANAATRLSTMALLQSTLGHSEHAALWVGRAGGT